MAYQTPWLLKTSAEDIVNNLNSVSSTIKNVSGSYETFSAKVNGDINYLSGAIGSTSSLLDSKITTLSNEYGLFSANTNQSIGEIKNALQTSSEWVNRSELSTSGEWVKRGELSNSGEWVKRDELQNSGKWVDRDELSQSSQWVNRNELSTSSNWNYAYDYIKGASGNIENTSAWVSTNGTNVIESASNALQWTNDFIKNSGHLIAGSNITITTSTNGIKIDSIGGDVPETYDLVEGDGISISSNDTQCKISVKDDYFNGKYQVAGNYLSANALNGVSGDWIKRNELANSGDWIKKDEFVYDIGISGKVDENGKLHLSAFGGEGSLNPPTNNGEWIYKIDNEDNISGWYDISQDSTQLVGVNGVEVNVGETATTIGLSGGMLEISAGQGIGINKEGNTLIISANGGGGIASVEVNAPLSGNGTHEEPIGIDGGVKELTGGNKINVSADGDKIVISYTGGEGGSGIEDVTEDGIFVRKKDGDDTYWADASQYYAHVKTVGDTDSVASSINIITHNNSTSTNYNKIVGVGLNNSHATANFETFILPNHWTKMFNSGSNVNAGNFVQITPGVTSNNAYYDIEPKLPSDPTGLYAWDSDTNAWKSFTNEGGDYLPLSGGKLVDGENEIMDFDTNNRHIGINDGKLSLYNNRNGVDWYGDVHSGPDADTVWLKVGHGNGYSANHNGKCAEIGVGITDVDTAIGQVANKAVGMLGGCTGDNGEGGEVGWYSRTYLYGTIIHPKGTTVDSNWAGDNTIHIILEDEP